MIPKCLKGLSLVSTKPIVGIVSSVSLERGRNSLLVMFNLALHACSCNEIAVIKAFLSWGEEMPTATSSAKAKQINGSPIRGSPEIVALRWQRNGSRTRL